MLFSIQFEVFPSFKDPIASAVHTAAAMHLLCTMSYQGVGATVLSIVNVGRKNTPTGFIQSSL